MESLVISPQIAALFRPGLTLSSSPLICVASEVGTIIRCTTLHSDVALHLLLPN